MKKVVSSILLVIMSITLFAQKDVLMQIDNKKITADEFNYIYGKNNSNPKNKKSVDEYLVLFEAFKLKVIEAESLKLDTASEFINELDGYKKQLSKPYLTEDKKYNELVKEAYERSKIDVKLDIVYIKLERNALPEDTLKAYNKAITIREKLVNGEDFETVVKQFSDDRGAARNNGHLPFLSLAKIPYSIQKFVISKNADKYSNPINTPYGYYIIKVVEKRQTPGQIKVAHIMVNKSEKIESLRQIEKKNNYKNYKPEQLDSMQNVILKKRIDSIYAQIQKGTDFNELLKHSDDKSTASKNGELPWFSTGKMVEEFENTAFALINKGDVSKPVQTRFGWHIIKLIDKKEVESFEEQEKKLRKEIERDNERKDIVKDYVIKNLKSKYNFKEIKSPKAIVNILDSSVFVGKWKYENKLADEKIFSVNNIKYSENDLAEFIENNQKRSMKVEMNEYVKGKYDEFVYKTLTDEEYKHLEHENPDFGFLMQEYHDGMLIFELTKKEVWDKASSDSVALKKFYKEHPEKFSSDGAGKVKITVFKYEKSKYKDKAVDLLENKRDEYTDEEIEAFVAKGDKEKLSIELTGTFMKGNNEIADNVFELADKDKVKGKTTFVDEDEKRIYYVDEVDLFKDKKFDDIKGIVISERQNYLEQEWVEKLRKKYKITINKKTLKKVKEQYN